MASSRQHIPEGEEEEEERKNLIHQQMQKSAELLEKLFLEGEEQITNVRVANDAREVDRREDEGMLQEKILEKLEEEATSAKLMFDEIADKWAAVLKYNDPLHINDEIASQREKCEELMRQKDGIIAMLKDELKQAEIKFSKDQRKQNEDISTLASRIEKQVILSRNRIGPSSEPWGAPVLHLFPHFTGYPDETRVQTRVTTDRRRSDDGTEDPGGHERQEMGRTVQEKRGRRSQQFRQEI